MNTAAENPNGTAETTLSLPGGSSRAAGSVASARSRAATSHWYAQPAWVLGLGAAIFLAGIALTAYDLYSTREQALSQWKLFASSQARQLAAHASQTMKVADQTHRWIAATVQAAGAQNSADLRRLMGTLEIHDAMVERQRNVPQIGVISLTDAAGDMINFTRSYPPRSQEGKKINLADRDYFVAHRNDASLELFLSRPVQNKGNGTWTFYLARKVTNRAGEMIGLVLVGLECKYFIDYYRQIAVPGISYSLFSRDGVNLARWPEGDMNIGKNFADSVPFALLRDHKGASVVQAKDVGMGTFAPGLRVVAPFELDDYPLVVNARLGEDVVLGDWLVNARHKVTADAVWGLFFVLLVVAVARLLRRNQQTIEELGAAKQALEENEAALERKVRDRNTELAAANHELEAFAYSISHDLRGPLRGIDGFSKRLEDLGSVDPEARRFIARIRSGTQKLGAIISDLMMLSKVMKSEPQLEWLDMTAMAREIADRLQAEAPARAVDWDIAEGMRAWADPRLMHTVMENLLGNAWKYTGGREHGAIRFSCTKEAGAHTVRFCVWDNGAGFDMKYAAGLFEPFKRLHGDHEFEGTGIGLSIVRRALQRQGGTIFGEGVVGVFAAFYFTLNDGAQSK